MKGQAYYYLGDKLTDEKYRRQICFGVQRPDGKYLRGKNGNMLVVFENEKVIVLARLLRKIKWQH